MRFDKFTVKAQDSIRAAEQEARQREAILAGEFSAGDTVHVDADSTATMLVFRRRPQATATASTAMSEGIG